MLMAIRRQGWPTFALTDIEAHLAIICASAPALKVLFQRQLPVQLSNAHASIRSASFRRANVRLGSEEHDSAGSVTKSSSKSHRLNQRSDLHDYDVENFTLPSRGTDKPLATRYVHISELQSR